MIALSRDTSIERLRSELLRAVHAVCPSGWADRAEDLVQTALVRLIERRRRGEGPEEPRPSYLRRVAYHALVDEMRRPHRRREGPLEPAARTSADRGADPERRTESGELARAIRRCLERLVASRRSAVSLVLLGHSVPEAARLLGWGAKKTENLVLRGRRDLRRCLEAAGWRP